VKEASGVKIKFNGGTIKGGYVICCWLTREYSVMICINILLLLFL
jgi:hypothetical protein